MINRLPRKLKKHLRKTNGLYRSGNEWRFSGPFIMCNGTFIETEKILDKLLDSICNCDKVDMIITKNGNPYCSICEKILL